MFLDQQRMCPANTYRKIIDNYPDAVI